MAYTAGTNSTNRTVAIGVVAVMHVLLAWAFAKGLARTAIEAVMGPVKVEMIKEEVKEKDLPPPPPPKEMPVPDIKLPPQVVPELTFDAAPAPNTGAITTQVQKAPPAPAPVVKNYATPFGLNKNGQRGLAAAMQRIYPPTSERLGEQGVVKVSYCMGADGKVNAQTTKLSQSSGYPRLDEAVMREATSGRFDKFFHPALAADGSGVESCAVVPFRFQINEQ